MALTYYEIPCGLEITPAPGHALLALAPRPLRSGSARVEPPLGVRADGVTVIYDPAQAIGYREVTYGEGESVTRGAVWIVVRETGVVATVTPKGQAPAPPAPEPVKRARRERPPVETTDMSQARAEAEKAAREALEAAGGAPQT